MLQKKKEDGTYGCYYQTPDQYGSDEYYELENVTYDDQTKKFTYTDTDNTKQSVDLLYATLTDAGNAYVSEK